MRSRSYICGLHKAKSKNVTAITPELLVDNGLASKKDLVKVLGRGELKAKLEVTAHGFSKTAVSAIEAAGGTVVTL